MIRELFKEAPYLMGACGLLIGFLIFLLVDGLASTVTQQQGTVVDKHYEAERSGLETGTAVTTDGEVGIVTTVETTPEQFVIMIKTSDQEVITLKCEPKLFYQKEPGDPMSYQVRRGLFTGWTWSVRPAKQ